jgi:N-acetylglucosaminyl-diphospho-decaprenol L-rhamnosyltransferase
MLDLAVIVVTWNVRALVLDAIRTLNQDLAASGLNAQVWISDNQSSDDTLEAIRREFPTTCVIANNSNLGFAAGNNVALRALGFHDQPTPNPNGPRAVFLLNPDTLVQPGAIRVLYDALFRLPKAGLVGANLSYEDGSFQHGAFRFPGLAQLVIELFPTPGRFYESRFNGRYPRELYAGSEPFPVDHTLGATMLLRREVIEQTGLFDEQFHMYCEEIDWSLRIHKAGWQIYTVPTAHITHLEGKSSKQIRPQSTVNLWTSRLKLYKKHYPPFKFAVARQLVQLGMRRRITQISQDSSISPDQQTALIDAYQRIVGLYAE